MKIITIVTDEQDTMTVSFDDLAEPVVIRKGEGEPEYGSEAELHEMLSGFLATVHGWNNLVPENDEDWCPCRDCSIETLPTEPGHRAEWYGVTDEVWAASGLEPNGGYLCIGCLESRLGRMLTPADFSEAPVNDLTSADNDRYAWTWRTPRLTARLSGTPE